VVTARIRNNPKFFPFFGNAFGALDGTHIACTIPAPEAEPFRNRKKFLSQNVMAACDFDMYFTCVLAGWEGSASDNSVYGDSLSRGFHIPPGRYYLFSHISSLSLVLALLLALVRRSESSIETYLQ
jgi:hypothetical protein